MKDCASCSHILQPQGGWCYMFREEPIVSVCAKHTLAEPTEWSLPSMPSFLSRDSLVNALTPSPDTAVKLVNLGLEMYQGAQTKLSEAASTITDAAQSAAQSTADTITDAASVVTDTAASGLSAVGDAASAGVDAVVAVGSGAVELAGGIAEGIGSVAGALTDL